MLDLRVLTKEHGLHTAIQYGHSHAEILAFAHSIGCHAADKYGGKTHATKAIVKWIEGERALHALRGQTRLANWPYRLTKESHHWKLVTVTWLGTESLDKKERQGYNTEKEAWEAFRQNVAKLESEHVPKWMEPRIQVGANMPVFASCKMTWTVGDAPQTILVLLTKEEED